MASENVTININANDNASGKLKKVGQNLKEMGEQVSMVGTRITGVFTLPIVAMGALILKQKAVADALKPVYDRFTALGVELGNAFLPLVKELVPSLLAIADNLSSIVKWFAALEPATKKNIVMFAGIVAAVGPLLFGFGQVMSTVGNMALIFSSLSAMAPGMSASLGTIAASAMAALGPLLPLIAAIGVLMALINSDFGKKGVQAGKQMLSMAAGGAGLVLSGGNQATANQWFTSAGQGLGALGPNNQVLSAPQSGGGGNVTVNYAPTVGMANSDDLARIGYMIEQAMRGRK